jgi:ubiquinone biosynthesis protein UbiJ
MPVVLTGSEEASGLADMLQQFIEQTLADSPRKVQQARRLAGRAVFRSAEDEELCVGITFAGERIELHDGGTADAADAMITADFLTIAHLTSGQESPFRLLAQRKLKVRFSVLQVPFLLGMLRFMQIDSETTPARWLWPVAAAVVGAAIYWYVTAHF